jgi:mono/diheme cytochrome c family protein
MRKSMFLTAFAVASVVSLAFARPDQPKLAEPAKPAEPAIDFARQIRPILSENCFACHGPDEKTRKAKLRLDTREGTFARLTRSEGFAVVPGKCDESKLVERVESDNPAKVMPPPKSGKTLKPEQIALLKKWIEQGAPYSTHWSFEAPKKPAMPKTAKTEWTHNPVDAFVLAELEKRGLGPSPEAEKTALVRRVTLDLTGLPPTSEEVDAFLADKLPEAYEKVVDRVLKSPRYGEHMARIWLDAARYGDTHGLHLDNYREMWMYRDWVIKAFNDNKPYDRFVVEQLAGDLLPNATLDQQIATGFLRCNISTSEGGSIDEEVYVRNVVDRIDTNGTVLLGLAVGCARCHDHKYDPVRTKDYYQMFAFFNNLDGNPLDGNAAQHPPVVKAPTAEQAAELKKLAGRADTTRKKIAEEVAKVKYDEADDGKEQPSLPRAEYVWIDDDLPKGAKPVYEGSPDGKWKFVGKPDHPVFSGEKSHQHTAKGQSQHFFTEASPGLRVGEGDVLFTYVYLDPKDPPKEIMLQWNSGDWKHRAYWGENLIAFGKDKSTERLKIGALPEAGKWVRLEVPAAKVGIAPGTVLSGWAFTQFDGNVYWDKAGLVTRTPQGDQPFDTLGAWLTVQKAAGGAGLPKNVQDAVKLDPEKRDEKQKLELREYFIANAWTKTRPTFDPLLKDLAAIDKERDAIEKAMPATMVWKERSDVRPAYVLKRGEYDQRGDKVERATPAFLPPMPADAPLNRLGFAEWLVAPNHPLTARVQVNRLWQQVFGTGLVKTAEDFGSQGDPPSHPELLDWLAVQYVEDGWDTKAMMKRLVMSAAYRQSSRATKDRLAKDPANRYLSRGPRYRLDAETLRDQALAVGGLLVEKVGGPSVKPPQPTGLWEAVGYVTSNTAKFVPDIGHEKVHRRSLYTFWKRTAPPPQMSIIDAPSRESCTVRRERTNTPLQALLLLNEPQYVEAARSLAERAMKDGGDRPEERIAWMFKRVTARTPDATETAVILEAYRAHLAAYQKDVAQAKKLIAVGETKPDAGLNPSELAAWTMIGNLLLNLDEVLNK